MAVLLAYNVTSDFAPSTTASNITGGTLTNNLLTSFVSDVGLGYATEPVLVPMPTSGATNASTAISTDSYFYLSISPTSGNSLSLTTLTFNIARGGVATPRGYDVRSSADNYATTLGTADVATQRPTWTSVSIDLSGASFQNVTSTITFRIYLYAPTTTNTLDIDDIVLNGSTASSGTVEQEGFRFRNDNGTETTATWLAAQDTNITQPKSTNTRLRFVLNSTLDRGAETYQLEYRKVGDTTWLKMT